jgi:hypothetical protein
LVDPATAKGLKEGKKTPREGLPYPPRIQIVLTTASLEKIPLACQGNSPQARIADSSSRNAVSFSSARSTKRVPSQFASAIQIVHPESMAQTQPRLSSHFGKIVSDDFPLLQSELRN